MRHVAAALIAVVLAGASSTPRGEVPPPEAREHKRDVTREVRVAHGLDGPIALHGALIHQESTWRPGARSSVGAQGLAQLMPRTVEHIEEISGVEDLDPMSPRQAIRGMARYTAWLDEAVKPDSWAMVLSAYNGGIGWLRRDRDASREAGRDPSRWWCSVEHVQTRSDAAQRENRHYVREIMLEHQPRYLRAGWPGPEVYR